jgi:hypothetical protein
MPNIQSIFDQLMARGSLAGLSDDKALDVTGILVDVSSDLSRDDGITRALQWCDELAARTLAEADAALIEYFRANAWGFRQKQKYDASDDARWDWEQPELLKQVLCLRAAARHPGFGKFDDLRRCQILTNLGNQLSTIGRFVEAVATWDRALEINPQFGMALGNRGYGLLSYARGLHDRGHRQVFLLAAHDALLAALSTDAQYFGDGQDAVKAFFAEHRAEIESRININKLRKQVRLDGYELGDSAIEQDYRRWALGERLFLNPLNDLGAHSIAARDVLVLPDYQTPIGEPPTLTGLFNQMKQEFVSARWMFYEGSEANQPHFSDRDVTLYNTLDYPSYSLAVEKMKAAYRIAYSLFDKIAFFLNDYAKLNVDPKQVYFRSIWYENRDLKKRVLRKELSEARNWPLRGLFWLSKDLFDPELKDTTEPDAQELYVIRNCLEHSYLKVHEWSIPATAQLDSWRDRLAYSVTRDELASKTLRVLKLTRAALIYLALAMHSEEQKRSAEKKTDKLVAPMFLDRWEDDWKL